MDLLNEFMYNRPRKPQSPPILFCSHCGWNSDNREWKFCGRCGKEKSAPIASGIPPPESIIGEHKGEETIADMIFYENDDDCIGVELLEEIYGGDDQK